MKSLSILIISLLLFLSLISMSACVSNDANSTEDSTAHQAAAAPSTTALETTTADTTIASAGTEAGGDSAGEDTKNMKLETDQNGYKRIKLESYLTSLTQNLCAPYSINDTPTSAVTDALIKTIVRCKHSSEFSTVSDEFTDIKISKSEANRISMLLFGKSDEELLLNMQNPGLVFQYDNKTQTYSLPTGFGLSGSALLAKDSINVTYEDDTKLTVTLSAEFRYAQIGTLLKTDKLEYSFDKVIDNNFCYYRLTGISLLESIPSN